MEAEAGDDLVGDKEGAVRLRVSSKSGDEPRLEGDDPHVGGHALHDDGSGLVAASGKPLVEGRDVIEGEYCCLCSDGPGDAR